MHGISLRKVLQREFYNASRYGVYFTESILDHQQHLARLFIAGDFCISGMIESLLLTKAICH